MYLGFDLKLDGDFFKASSVERDKFEENQNLRVGKLEEYFLSADVIDAERVLNFLFPNSKSTHVFLSHSHADRDLAINFAVGLKRQFDLNVFVDSCVWGSSTSLLRSIDDKYCMQTSGSYNYNKRNQSTAHVYMILITALQRMINECECLFFLNTDNALPLKKSIRAGEKTYSPWIHSELMFSSMVQRVRWARPMFESANYNKSYATANDGFRLKVAHEAVLSHLNSMNDLRLSQWITKARGDVGLDALDKLYEMFGA